MVTRTDIIVVVIGLFAGYFLVSWIVGKLGRNKSSPSAGSERPRQPQDREEPRGAGSTQSAPSAPPWYDVLGVPAYASLDQIKAAYRRKIAQYHPDKTSTLGDELRALAEVKTKELNTAYDAALRATSR